MTKLYFHLCLYDCAAYTHSVNDVLAVKRVVHPKMKNLSLNAHPHVVPNPFRKTFVQFIWISFMISLWTWRKLHSCLWRDRKLSDL